MHFGDLKMRTLAYVVAIALVCAAGVAQADIIVNANSDFTTFEGSGLPTSWAGTDGSGAGIGNKTTDSPDGSAWTMVYYASLGQGGGYGGTPNMYFPVAGDYTLSWLASRIPSYDWGASHLLVRLFDVTAGTNPVYNEVWSTDLPNTPTYGSYSSTFTVDASQVGHSFEILVQNWGGASFVNIDNMRLTCSPEPSTVVLLVSGVVGLLAYAWRKRK
jgi:hypothetical protein